MKPREGGGVLTAPLASIEAVTVHRLVVGETSQIRSLGASAHRLHEYEFAGGVAPLAMWLVLVSRTARPLHAEPAVGVRPL